MKWFGKAYGAPYERDTEHVPTPVGETCIHCDEPIAELDDGLLVPHFDAITTPWSPLARHAPYHYECHMRGIIGGINHLRGRCQCCGGSEPPDPPDLTKREAACAAAAYFQLYGAKAIKL